MIALVLLATSALGAPEILLGLSPGQSKAEAERALTALKEVSNAAINQRQALADNLVRTHFLETLNRFHLAPVNKEGELDLRKFQQLVRGKREGAEYVCAFSEKELSFVFVRVPVPVDSNNDRPDRLHRLRESLRAIANEGWTIAPKEKDKFGNVYAWTGRGRDGAKIVLWYVPEHDELRILAHGSS